MILIQINRKESRRKSRQISSHLLHRIKENYCMPYSYPPEENRRNYPNFLHDITDNHLPDEIVNTQTACGAHFWRPNVEIAISYCPSDIAGGNWKVLGNKCPSDRVIVFCRVLAGNGISSRFQLIPMHRDSRSHSR